MVVDASPHNKPSGIAIVLECLCSMFMPGQVARYLTEELKIDSKDKTTICGVQERCCSQCAASVYMLSVANTSIVHM